MWVKECKESLIKHMDIMLLPSPDESNPTSSVTPASGTCMGTFNSLMDLEILGDCSTSMAETETAEEELVHYLHTAGCNMKQDPLLWWKKNAPLYPILAHTAHDVLAIPGKSVNLFILLII